MRKRHYFTIFRRQTFKPFREHFIVVLWRDDWGDGWCGGVLGRIDREETKTRTRTLSSKGFIRTHKFYLLIVDQSIFDYIRRKKKKKNDDDEELT